HAGDIIEISTRNRGGPNPNWLSKDNRFVKTKDARKKIAHYFRAQMKETLIRKGHEIVDRELSSHGLRSVLPYDQVAAQLGLSTVDELKHKLGSGEISLERLRTALTDTPSLSKEEMAREADQVLLESKGESAVLIDKAVTDDHSEPDIADEGLSIASTTGLMSKIGHCCYPLPYENIVGFVTRGHGVTIHRIECPNVIKNTDQDRIVPAEWGKTTNQGFRSQIVVEALNRKGLIADIGQVVARENVDIIEAHAVKRAHWAVFELQLEVTDLDQLDLVMDKIRQTSGVRSAHRKLG
ncbi:MAG: ACT domain-containing protein, partial [Chloroflexota bacterium]